MSSAAQSTRTLDVFLVEDSAPIRKRLVELLAPVEGARIVGQAEGANDAIHDIVEQRPDTVVLDMNLAQGSGLEVLRALRYEAPEVEVLVLTNFADPQYRRACSRLGARGFFDKSTEFEKVRDAIAARASHHIQ